MVTRRPTRIVREPIFARYAVSDLMMLTTPSRDLKRMVMLRLYRKGRKPTRGRRPGSYRAFGKPSSVTWQDDPLSQVRIVTARWEKAVAVWRVW